jgi:DNA-binding transcriptional ArsR family regulator
MDGLVALADPTRRRIVEMLGQGELSAGAIAEHFAISAPAISQHLKALKAARLVRSRADAQRRIYALDPAGFIELEDWLQHMRAYWSGRLDTLERKLRDAAARDAPRKSEKHK